jgi:hypothetical protein
MERMWKLRARAYLEIEHAGLGSRANVLAGSDLVESYSTSVSCLLYSGKASRGKLTVELEEVVGAGLGGKLLGVDDSLLEGVALRGRHLDVGLFRSRFGYRKWCCLFLELVKVEDLVDKLVGTWTGEGHWIWRGRARGL